MTAKSAGKSSPAAISAATPSAPDNTREKLLAAALEQFGEHGYDGATIRDIARAARVNIALVSYHFGSKEQLYHELLRSLIPRRMQAGLDMLASTHGRARLRRPAPAEAVAMLKTLLAGFTANVLSSRDILLTARLLIREQTRPTAGFNVVYTGGMETLHKTITRLLAIAGGRKPETHDSIIRAHMLIGQMLSFVFANAAICRRLGKKSLDKRTLSAITAILNENIDALAKPALP